MQHVSSPSTCCALCSTTTGCPSSLTEFNLLRALLLTKDERQRVSAAGRVWPRHSVASGRRGWPPAGHECHQRLENELRVPSRSRTLNLSMAELGYITSLKLVAVETHDPSARPVRWAWKSSVRPIGCSCGCGAGARRLRVGPAREPDKWVSVSDSGCESGRRTRTARVSR